MDVLFRQNINLTELRSSCTQSVGIENSLLLLSSLGDNPLAFLRTQPQFLHMRQAIQQNPALLPALLQQLGRENPQLLQVTLWLTTPTHPQSGAMSSLLL